jgi:epoxide hydrolase-like predicted phosphatase
MSTRAVDAVIFDLGGVIMRNGSPRDFTQQYPDHDPAHIAELIMGPHHLDTDHPWHQVERGEITFAQCREMTQQLLHDAGVTRPLSPAKESTSKSSSFAFELNDDMVAFIHDLGRAQIPTAILTNNVREFRQWWWPLLNFDELFTTIVDSHEVGMRKPNPAIYQLTLDRLGVEATRAAFLDDLHANVVAASAVGLHGIHVEQDSLPAIHQARTLTGLM